MSEEQSRKKVMTAAISGHDEERGAPGTGRGRGAASPVPGKERDYFWNFFAQPASMESTSSGE